MSVKLQNLMTWGSGNQTLINDSILCTLQTCGLTLSSLLYIPNLAGYAPYLEILGLVFSPDRSEYLLPYLGFTFAISFGLVRILPPLY